MKSLYSKFVELVENTKQALNTSIEKKTYTFNGIASYLGEYFRIKGLTNTTDISNMFEALWPHYSYLDIEVLEVIIENKKFLIEEKLLRDMQTYREHLEEFKQSTTLNKFKNAVEEALIPNPEVTSITCEVVIKLNRQWGKKTLENFKTLVNHMFHQRMTHIHVEEGSVCVTLLVPQSKLDYILEIASLKKEFASLIGIFELTIDGQSILKDEDKTQFTFDQTLQESSNLGDDEAVQFLLDLIDNVDYQNEKGSTALMLASEGGYEQVVQTLVSAGANVNIQDNNGYTALMLACDTNSYTIVNYLLQAGANPDIQRNDGDTAIIIACHNNHSDIVKLLLQFNADQLITNINDDIALTVATRQNSIEIVEMLLEHLAESQKTSAVTSALTTACQYGHSQIIISLLAKLYEFFLPEEFQLFISCAKGDDNSTKRHIYDTNVNINCILANDITPLMIASSCGHTETVQVLLQAGANVNSTDSNGYNPLVYAITGHKSLQVIEQLLKAGAQPNVFINDQSIVDKVREEGREDICKLLQQFSVMKIKKSEEEVLEQLLKICDSFTILNEAILSSLQKLITEGTVLIVDVVEFLHHYLGDTELKVDNIDQLINVLQPHYYFLNVDLLRKIVDKFFGGKLQNRLQDYISMVKGFEETTQLQLFVQAIKHIPLLQPPVTTTRTCTMIIKFHEQWQQKNVAHLHKFLNYSFSKEIHFLNHIVIEEEGSSCVYKFVVPKCQLDSLIVIAIDQREFMYQVGVYEVYIGDLPILIEDYNHIFSFRYALQRSIEAENHKLVSFLMEIDVSLQTNNKSLHEAARDGNINAVELVLKEHVDINIQDENGETALILASKNGHIQVVELLLKEHADINIQNQDGHTAIMLAIENVFTQIMELLGEHVDDDIQDENAMIALMVASQSSHTRVAELLLKEHADIADIRAKMLMLMLASMNGHTDIVKLLIKDIDVHVQSEDIQLILMFAILYGHAEIVEFLKDLVGIQAEKKVTALMCASMNGHLQVVELLLKDNADVNAQEEDGFTALMVASENGHTQVVELLLKEHADIKLQTNDGVTALMLASQNGHQKVIELLLKQHIDINHQGKDGVTAQMPASQDGHHQLIEHTSINNKEKDGWTALMLASRNGYFQVVELLLKEHADINTQKKDGWTALMLASSYGHFQVVELLLKEHADINTQKKDGWTALMLASLNGHIKIIELLLKEHADINIQKEDGWTALMLASLNGHIQVVELLLKEYPEINAQEKDGWTALMIASQKGHFQVVELLLKKHADINTQKEDGWTALMLASFYDHTQVVELLLKVHAEINTRKEDGWTALMLASCNGHTQVVKLLLHWNADVNIQTKDHQGYNALMLASANGHLEVAKYLLQSQADPYFLAYNRATAFSLAAFGGNRELINMLLDKVQPTFDEIEKAVVESCLGGHSTLITFFSNKLPHLTNDQRELLDSCVKGDLGTVIMKTLDSPDSPLVLGLTPLMVASSCGHVDIVDALIQIGADVNKQESYWGFTPLFFAIRGSKSASITETLLKNGANPDVIAEQRTLLDVANEINQGNISDLIIKYGGQTRAQLEGTKDKKLSSTSHEQNTVPLSLQTTDELMDIKTYENSRYTIKREMKQKRFQIPSIMSKLHLLTPYILNPTHTFRNTSMKHDNKKEAKEVYTVSIN